MNSILKIFIGTLLALIVFSISAFCFNAAKAKEAIYSWAENGIEHSEGVEFEFVISPK